MWNAKRTILILMLVCAGFVPVCSAGTARSKAKPKNPSAAELLDKYVKSQDKIKSFVLEYEDEYMVEKKLSFLFSHRFKKGATIARGGYLGEIRSDGNRHFSREKPWSDYRLHLPSSKEAAKSDPRYRSFMWDGENMYQYVLSKAGAEKDKLFLFPQNNKRTAKEGNGIIKRVRDKALRGSFEDSYARVTRNERIDAELRKARKISVQDKMEDVGGSKCYVIKAETKDSKYKIWIDPEHGYNIAQAEISRGGKGTEFGNDREISIFTYLRNVQFKKIDDVWVTMEADYGFYRKMVAGDFEKEDHHCKRTEFVLNPDHEALGSFETDFIRYGASTHLIGTPGILYIWRDGQVVDKSGQVVFDSKSKKTSRR